VRTGLDHTSLPMRLYHKAKRLGVWNPKDLDFSQDRRDWLALTEPQQATLSALTSMFVAGEESVTLDLLPLMLAVSSGGHTEEAMYLTTFLFEEAKHTEFFERAQREVFGLTGDLSHWHGDSYRQVFYTALPEAMNALLTDHGPVALARASTTYNMIVEGVLAETGYHAFRKLLFERGLMPGVLEGITLLQRDESRHIAYGLHLLGRLLRDDTRVWDTIQDQLNALLPLALGVIPETLARAELDGGFGLNLDELLVFALGQYQSRLGHLQRARDGGELQSEDEGTAV
jgi:ribonucleoside-diphosphate reductase beta chain